VGLITTDEFGSPTAKGKLYLPSYTDVWDKEAPKFKVRYLAAFSTVHYPPYFEQVLDSVSTEQGTFDWAKEVVEKSVEGNYIDKPVCMITAADREVVEKAFGEYKELDWAPR
jgi:hypothetical protein